MSKIIVIDPGHGGKDAGAVNSSRYEKIDNLRFSLALEKALKRQGFTVYLTRSRDIDMSLRARSDFANHKKADYFISCHRNSFPLSTAHGMETWVYKRTDSNTLRFAQYIQDELVKVGVQANRGVKKGNFHVCRETNMPAVLCELNFIKNAKDNELYDSKFNEYVEAVVKGVCKHCGVTYKAVEQPKPMPTPNPTEPNSTYRVQVGAFSNRANAQRLQAELESKGYPAIIV